MDSSSSSSLPFPAPLQEKYDVFLSFRNRLEKGDDIGPTLLEAIEKSKPALVIFSKDYASSTRCLKELVHILECKKSYGQIVIRIFYCIDQSDVRKQPIWRAALEEAANMSGFHYSSKTGRTEADFVEEVVQLVLTKLNRESSRDLKDLVGIEKKIEQIESLLCLDSPGVCCVGIWAWVVLARPPLLMLYFTGTPLNLKLLAFLQMSGRTQNKRTDYNSCVINLLVRY